MLNVEDLSQLPTRALRHTLHSCLLRLLRFVTTICNHYDVPPRPISFTIAPPHVFRLPVSCCFLPNITALDLSPYSSSISKHSRSTTFVLSSHIIKIISSHILLCLTRCAAYVPQKWPITRDCTVGAILPKYSKSCNVKMQESLIDLEVRSRCQTDCVNFSRPQSRATGTTSHCSTRMIQM